MDSLIVALVEYVQGHKVTGHLHRAIALIGEDRMRVVSIKILKWIKEQARIGQRMPLHLNENYSWCNELRTLWSELGEFRSLLSCAPDRLDFADDLSEPIIQGILAYVNERYSPRLRT